MKSSIEFVEKTIARTPVTPWFIAGVLSIPISLALFLKGRKLAGLLVGMWAPTLFNASMYNRLLRSV